MAVNVGGINLGLSSGNLANVTVNEKQQRLLNPINQPIYFIKISRERWGICHTVTPQVNETSTRMVQLPATAAIEYVAACCRTKT